MRMRIRSLASLSGLRIWHCCELWYKLQKWLGSGMAMGVAKAGSRCSFDSAHSLGTSCVSGQCVLSLVSVPGSFVINALSLDVQCYFWVLSAIPWAQVSLFVP